MKKYYLYDIPVFLVLLVFWTWLYLTYFYSYIALVFYGNWPQDDWLVPSVLILGLAGLSFLFARSLYTKRLSRRLIQGTYALYFILLFSVLFLKNIGLQGFNLDLLSFSYNWAYGDKLVPTMNIIMFIPLGLLFPLTRRNLALFTLAISLAELCQYFLHLGIFDIGDILTNLAGFALGSLLLKTSFIKRMQEHIY